MPFVPGRSGNPGGRPAGEANVRAAAREHTDTAIGVLVSAMDDPDARVRIKAAEVLLDRGWGKAAQPIGGDDGHPIRTINEVRYHVIESGGVGYIPPSLLPAPDTAG